MAKKGKKYQEALSKFDKNNYYNATEALGVVVEIASAKFDETVEAHIKLGVDSRHADQQVRGAVVLPNGTGKTQTILNIIANAVLNGQSVAVVSSNNAATKNVYEK